MCVRLFTVPSLLTLPYNPLGRRLEAAADGPLRASTKLATLAHSLATKHAKLLASPDCAPSLAALRAAAAKLESMMAKPAVTALSRIAA